MFYVKCLLASLQSIFPSDAGNMYTQSKQYWVDWDDDVRDESQPNLDEYLYWYYYVDHDFWVVLWWKYMGQQASIHEALANLRKSQKPLKRGKYHENLKYDTPKKLMRRKIPTVIRMR